MKVSSIDLTIPPIPPGLNFTPLSLSIHMMLFILLRVFHSSHITFGKLLSATLCTQ